VTECVCEEQHAPLLYVKSVSASSTSTTCKWTLPQQTFAWNVATLKGFGSNEDHQCIFMKSDQELKQSQVSVTMTAHSAAQS